MTLRNEYPVSVICKVLPLASNSFYYQPKPDQKVELKKALQQVAGEWPMYRYRRLTAQLKREGHVGEGHVGGETRVRCLGGEMHLVQPQKRMKIPTTNSQHPFPSYPNLVQVFSITRPDQVWVAYITYIRLAREFVYLVVLTDVFTRCIRGWHLDRYLDQTLTLTPLRQALSQSIPDIHHSDQGVPYEATTYVKLLQQYGVQVSMANAGEAWQNGYAERLRRTVIKEEVDPSEYQDYYDSYHQISRFLDDVYTRKRIHSALGYLTPAEYE